MTEHSGTRMLSSTRSSSGIRRQQRDGIGDLSADLEAGLLQWLGIRGLDAAIPRRAARRGYDVADYTGIHPLRTLDNFRGWSTRRIAASWDHRGAGPNTPPIRTRGSRPRAIRPPGAREVSRLVRLERYGPEVQRARIIFVDYEPSNWTTTQFAAPTMASFLRPPADLNYDTRSAASGVRVLQFLDGLGGGRLPG